MGKCAFLSSFSAGNDILICGTCKSMYSSLATFVQHKKQKCELKTLCRCQNQPIVENSFTGKLTTKAITNIFFSCKCVINELTCTRHKCQSSGMHQYTHQQEVKTKQKQFQAMRFHMRLHQPPNIKTCLYITDQNA